MELFTSTTDVSGGRRAARDRRIVRRPGLVGVVALAACAAGGPGDGGTSPLTAGRRDEVVTIGAHNEITQVSAGERLVFAASERGVIIYDALFRGWLPPLAMGDRFRLSPTTLAADPTEDAVWIGTTGRVVYHRPRIDYTITATVAGAPQELFFDRRDLGAGAYVRSGASFVRVTRTGGVAPVPLPAVPPAAERLRPPTAQDVFRQFPSLQAFLPLMTRGDDLEQWPTTAATVTPGRTEVWLGTGGNGLWRIDPGFNQAEHLPFGLLAAGVGALAPAADGVWSGGLGAPGERGGLTFASADLQRWRWLTGPPARPFVGARVNALSIRERTAWIATSRGLLRMDLDDDTRMSRWDAGDGLPSDMATSVAVGAGGTWVGTTAGLALVETSPRTVGPRIAVRDIVLWADTLWIASSSGVLALVPPDSLARRVTADDARLARDARAIAKSDSVVAVATESELIEIDLKANRVLPSRAASFGALRRIVRLRMDAQTIWLAGDGGVLVIHRPTGRSALLAVGLTLSAPATDIVLTREAAWIGTHEGLVRVRRRSDGMPP